MDYFKLTNPLPSVYRFEDPRGVFATLLVGEKQALLVDTGMGIGNISAAVCRITALPLIVANTHGHIDHMGGNYQFDHVYLHEADYPVVQNWIGQAHKQRILEIAPTLIPEDFDAEKFYEYHGENLEALNVHMTFDLGGLRVDVVPMQTHTQGSVGYLCRERELLLTGDCISDVVYLVFPESSTVSKHIAMLEAVQELPFSVMLSSHCEALMEKGRVESFLHCAKNVDPAQTVLFRNPLFPEYREHMFVDNNPGSSEEYAALVYSEDKLDTEGKEC